MTKLLKASDPMGKYRFERDKDHYDLCINRCYLMCLAKYSEIISKSKPSTYDQVLIGEVLALLESASEDYISRLPRPRVLSRKVYNDLKATFRRSRKAGEAKALALAKKLYIDDFNQMMQNHTWVEINNGSSGVLKLKMINDSQGYAYSLRFNDGVDSITLEYYHHFLLYEFFTVFWYFKTQRIKQLFSFLLNSWCTGVRSSIRGVKGETLFKALEVALRHDTTLGAALFLTARE